MQVDDKTVRKIARLARIRVKDTEVTKLGQDIGRILSWIEQLNEVDTKNVEPMFSVNLQQMPRRHDVISDGDAPKAVLANAPQADFDMFIVPKVVE